MRTPRRSSGNSSEPEFDFGSESESFRLVVLRALSARRRAASTTAPRACDSEYRLPNSRLQPGQGRRPECSHQWQSRLDLDGPPPYRRANRNSPRTRVPPLTSYLNPSGTCPDPSSRPCGGDPNGTYLRGGTRMLLSILPCSIRTVSGTGSIPGSIEVPLGMKSARRPLAGFVPEAPATRCSAAVDCCLGL